MKTAKQALITGIGGQDGWYLARFLQANGYRVAGTSRNPSAPDLPGTTVFQWDGADVERIRAILAELQPDEIYNFAASTSGSGMYDDPLAIGDSTGTSVVRLLEAVRQGHPATKFLQASSSEVFGLPEASPQSEHTPRNPRSPYGAAKAYADAMVAIYRRRHGLFACSAILFNHESPRRRETYVTRRVSRGVARIRLGLATELALGDLDARRDWGYAGDYVRGMWSMLQTGEPRDVVLATGVTHSVRDLCEVAFERAGLDYREHVRSEREQMRPAESTQLVGDPGFARAFLGWQPERTFRPLIESMVDFDLADVMAEMRQEGQA